MANDVNVSDYQEIDDISFTSVQDQPDIQNNENAVGVYSLTEDYQIDVEAAEANYGSVNTEQKPTQIPSTSSNVGADTVEYTTVRAINEPNQIYAVVHKPNKS